MNKIALRIGAILTSLDWNSTELATWGYAIKVYATAVGPKEAHVYLRLRKDQPTAILTGTYCSEGWNALSTCWRELPLERPETLEDAVRSFAAEVDRCVAQTYAVRLLRHAAS